AGYVRSSMNGICVAVNATTSTSSRSRYTTLKLWKSRPAAPMMRTRRGIGRLRVAAAPTGSALRQEDGVAVLARRPGSLPDLGCGLGGGFGPFLRRGGGRAREQRIPLGERQAEGERRTLAGARHQPQPPGHRLDQPL